MSKRIGPFVKRIASRERIVELVPDRRLSYVLVSGMPLRDYRAAPELSRHDGEPWHLHYRSTAAGLATEWGAGCAVGLAVVLDGQATGRLGVCRAGCCDRVFVDVSRNASRRFCSEACLNRTKVAAFRARSRAAT